MDTAVSCPVCTLYLREGVSLQTHLNTHPKDQVIEALLKFCSSVRDGTAQSEVESVLAAQYAGEQGPEPAPAMGDPAEAAPSQQYPPSSSHFTAAVTYQQFMSSNASVGGTVLPQCFSVPAIIATPAGEVGPATLMPLLYNPYVIQQQQQQLQFYNAFRTVPQQPLQRQILSPSTLFPISPQFSVAPGGNHVFPSNVPVSSSTATTLQCGDNFQPNPPILVPTIADDCEEAKHIEKDEATASSASISTKLSDVEDKAVSPKHVSQCNESQNSCEEPHQQQAESNIGDNASIVCEDLNSESLLTFESGAKISSNNCTYKNESSKNKSVSDNCDKQSESDDDTLIIDEEVICSEDSHINPVSPNLRVRTDLSKVNSETIEGNIEDNKNNEIDNICVESDEHKNSGEISATVVKCAENGSWGFLAEAEKNEPEECPLNSKVRTSSEYITSDLYTEGEEEDDEEMGGGGGGGGEEVDGGGGGSGCEAETEGPSEQVSCTPPVCTDSSVPVDARHFKIVDIEGVHVLVPTHFLAAEGSDNNEAVLRPTSHPSRCRDQTDCETEGSVMANQDIHTDEVMPPMGELSGQESLGENDTSSWSQEKEDVATSYDLLAREKWEVSDGSDEETDALALALRPVPKPLLHPVAPSPVPPAPPAPPALPEDGAKPKKKKKEKLRCVYKCWRCDEAFTCPKERRVHQSERHGAGAVTGGKAAQAPPPPSPPAKAQEPAPPLALKEESDPVKEEAEVHVKAEEEAAAPGEEEDACASPTPTLIPVLAPPLGDAEDLKGVRTFDELGAEAAADEEAASAFKFICSRCENAFASAKSLHRHVRSVHGHSQFTCRTCGERFPSEATYLAHLKVHPLECSRCGKYFYRHQNLNLHIRRHLGIKPFKCSICDKAFVTKQKLAEHTNTHTGDTPIKCGLCSETFRRYSNLIQHKNRHHLKLKKKVKDFVCQCGEVFHSQKKLQWHKEIHDEKPKTCNYCSERFVHASSLTRHIRKAHDRRYFPCSGRDADNVECPVCGCVFLKSSLAVHMRLHSGERPFGCHICGKNFSTKWNLQLHRWTHASRSLKPFKCSLCKSAFIRHSEYTAHMHSHRNVRPYTCNFCGSQFIRKYNCIRHAREHEGEKAFSCDVCHKAFHRRYYLKEHMRTHSGARPFACHICGKTSSTKSNHNKHVKIHHAREAVNTEG